MGKTIKCTYKLELSFVNFNSRRKEWQTFGLMASDIKPNEKDVKRYRDAMNESLMNGSNKHLSSSQSLYSNAILTDQRTGEVVVKYNAPMFEVI